MTDADFRDLFARVEEPFEPRPEFVARLLGDIDAVATPPGAVPGNDASGAQATTDLSGPRREPGYLVGPPDHEMVALARPHAPRRRAIAVLAAVAAVIVVTVAVAVTRPGAHHQTKPAVPPPTPTTVAPPQLYWRDATGIGRANLDGTGIHRLIPFTVGVNQASSPKNGGCGLAVDHNYLYWPTGDTLARAKLDGTGVDTGFIVTGPGTNCVAVDGGHVYWVTTARATSDGTIGRANLDGTGVQQAFVPDAMAPCGVAVDRAHIYWGNSSTGAIGRANLDGTGVTQDFVTGPNIPSDPPLSPCGVVVDRAHIYWGNGFVTPPGISPESCATCFEIGEANLDGTGEFETHDSGPGPFLAFNLPCAEDGTYLYWTYSGTGTDGPANTWIGRARLDSSSPWAGLVRTDVKSDFIIASAPGGSLAPTISGCAIGP